MRGGSVFFASGMGRVTSQSLSTGAARILADGHGGASALVIDDDAVYYLETGWQARAKGQTIRSHCCAINAAPR